MASQHSVDPKREELKKRFRRSGSFGMPFLPEGDIPTIKEYIKNEQEGCPLLTLIIASCRKTTSLVRILQKLQELSLSIHHIESRGAKHKDGYELEILLQLQLLDGLRLETVMKALKDDDRHLHISEIACTIPETAEDQDQVFSDPGTEEMLNSCPWFPRTMQDLDKSSKRVLMYGSELDADHPGFKDAEYRKRRMMFADIALNHKHGQPIPRIEYTDQENATWRTIYRELRVLHEKHACKEFLENFILLVEYCGYSEDNIPQLEDINRFLKAKTGFQVRPVAGYLSSRDFLAGLAFRVFHCTQYIRHPKDPFYSPEPDCCHELLGHMPLFADPDFAQFSQEIGLASLGASEEQVKHLATVYFFTIEFGLCGESSNQLKIYGAGLLSSIGELKHVVSGAAEMLPFDPDRVIQQEMMITTYQTAYFYNANFEEAQQKIRMMTSNMRRAFVVRYNPYTESVEILNNKRSLTLAINSMRSDINLLSTALHKVL